MTQAEANAMSMEGMAPDSTPNEATRDLEVGARRIARRSARHEANNGWVDRAEAFISRLSSRDTFWNRIFSFIFLPLAFFSGIRMRQLDDQTFSAVLPFKRFNKNWYHAMAGGALLANSEIAGGMYVFGICGDNYAVVCKNLQYTFLRPCFGPAVYRMNPRENLRELVRTGEEFNVTLDLDIRQQGIGGQRDKRVGKCEVTFHVTPKAQLKARRMRKK
ncbi:MAG: PaaI family thioesterase [Phycisphaerae bacterium]